MQRNLRQTASHSSLSRASPLQARATVMTGLRHVDLNGYYNCDSTAIRLRYDYDEKCACSVPCDAMRCTVFAIVILSVRLSVRLSVCLSVTLVDCVHMVRLTIMISSPYGRPIILVSGDIKFIPKFEGDHPERGR